MSSTKTQTSCIDPQILADLEAAAHYAVTGQCDPDTLRRIDERAARARQEVRDKMGVQEISAQIIREMRDTR